MNCVKCKAELPAGAKFCGYCGAPVEQQAFCPACGEKVQPGQIFCTSCGMRISGNAPVKNTESLPVNENIQSSSSNVTISRIPSGGSLGNNRTGQLFRKMNSVTMYYGEVKPGITNKVGGTFCVYDNRVEFVIKTWKEAKVEIYFLNDVAAITTGRYMGMFVTLVLALKNGEKVSFCSTIPGSKDLETVANFLQVFMDAGKA